MCYQLLTFVFASDILLKQKYSPGYLEEFFKDPQELEQVRIELSFEEQKHLNNRQHILFMAQGMSSIPFCFVFNTIRFFLVLFDNTSEQVDLDRLNYAAPGDEG